jgi:hypothetical protein
MHQALFVKPFRELIKSGTPLEFVVLKTMVANGVTLNIGESFPGATERRTRLLYEQKQIGTPEQLQVKLASKPVQVEKPKTKAKKTSKVK